MKFKLFSLAALIFIFVSVGATTRTLNQNSNSPGQYTNFDSVQAHSSSGDTILVSGAILSYGQITLNTPLVIIGTGWHPQNQDSITSVFGTIVINGGASGSIITGLVIDTLTFGVNSPSNCIIRRCEIAGQIKFQYNEGYNNNTIQECYFAGTGSDLAPIYNCTSCLNNWQIKNCIFNGFCQVEYEGTVTNFVFDHCIFLGASLAFNENFGFNGATFTNSIFYGPNPITTFHIGTFTNCLSFNCTNDTFPAGSIGCLTNVNPQFVNFPGGLFSYYDNFAIASNSPAHKASDDGTDLGVTGGTTAEWNQNGIPLIPQVNYINIPSPVVTPGATVQFQFKSYVPR